MYELVEVTGHMDSSALIKTSPRQIGLNSALSRPGGTGCMIGAKMEKADYKQHN